MMTTHAARCVAAQVLHKKKFAKKKISALRFEL